MPQRGMNDLGAFAIPLEQIGANLWMAAFGVVIGRFANVVKSVEIVLKAVKPS